MHMEKSPKREGVPQESLEKKWEAYAGTGIRAHKEGQTLALRRGLADRDEYAIVLLKSDYPDETTPFSVLDEFRAIALSDAEDSFMSLAKQRGFATE